VLIELLLSMHLSRRIPCPQRLACQT
jgi:hypothetical protein